MASWLLPENLSDALPSEARRVEECRRKLLDLYRVYGYELIAPPLIEHLDSLLTGSGSRLAMRTFQTVDQLSGKTLGIRADMTPQAARIDAHNLNRVGVSRLCYAGPVLHTRPASALASREPYQVGAELFGHAGSEAEIEILELMIRSLRAAGLDAIRVDIGHAGIVPALLDEARRIDPDCLETLDTDLLHDHLVQKDAAGLARQVKSLPGAVADGLRALVDLYGVTSDPSRPVIDLARKALPPTERVTDALDRLQQLADSRLWSRYEAVRPSIDLADLQGYHYYTGICFTAFSVPSGDGLVNSEALARGGRYDGVGRAFGRNRAAAGFSLELRSLVRAGSAASGTHRPVAIRAPWSDSVALLEKIAALRNSGEIVVQILPGHEQEQEEFACDRELIEQDGSWAVQKIK